MNYRLVKLLDELEIYEDKNTIHNLANQINGLYSNIIYPYRKLESLPDSTKGDCPCCPKGLLAIDLQESFSVTLHGRTFSFDVIVCDRCSYVYLEKETEGESTLIIGLNQ